jgi:hypothetical protein
MCDIVRRFPCWMVATHPAHQVLKFSSSASAIKLISHSSSPSTITRGGGGWTCPGNGSVATGSNSETWKTGWIFIDGGRSNSYEYEDILFFILNFPNFLKSSFENNLVVLMFFSC